MFTKLLTLSALFCTACSLSIGTVSEQNVKKREASTGDQFPDWVPFKNKHGDDLGEFVQVEKKSNVKKRLAPPVNFLMRSVVEDEGDEYYDKGAGESDGEDYFEKKDWSDLHRSADTASKKVKANHTDISDIDGVVSIITKRPPSPILEAIEEAQYLRTQEKKKEQPRNILDKEPSESEDDIPGNSEVVINKTTQKPIIITTTNQPKTEEIKKQKKDINDEEYSDDYEDETSGKPKKTAPEADKESEARKALILSSVDELKERHAEEQRELSDRIKGENLYKDEFGKKYSKKPPNRFSGESSEETERPERHKKRGKKTTVKPDYDEYDDLSHSLEDKYKVNVQKITESPQPFTKLPLRTTKITTREPKREKTIDSGKMTVFKNPRLFVAYDDSNEQTTVESTAPTRGQQKFSSRYTTTSPTNNDGRISLVPADSKEGEPTLFFPKTRRNKKKRIRTTTPADADSLVAETVTDNYKQITSQGDTTAYDTATATDSTVPVSTHFVTGPETTGRNDYDTTGTSSDAVTDAIPASSAHKTKETGDFHKEKGASREHHSEHSEEHEEHGKKAYEGHHEHKKAAKGHHDKENHLGKYDDHGGVNKHHSEESGHYGGHHHEERGKKHAKYEESGKHSKGHSTKGSHDVHKKEEYEKKVEFFEEEGDGGDEEKHGGYNSEKEHSEGGRFKKGNLKAGHENHAKGESGHFNKGGHHSVNKGHKLAYGHDGHGKDGRKHFNKEGKAGGNKWIYHHGYPAKTASLVVIDRRGDQYFHGPQYYG